jgi:hypothetical protein
MVWSFTTTTSIDLTAPAVKPPDGSFVANSQLGTSDISAQRAWSATDNDSGVASYELQQSTNGGAFQNVSLLSPTATSTTLRLSPGSIYQFRVRATDVSGNTSDWATGSQFVVADHQESDANITYTAGWINQSLAPPTVARSSSPKAPARAQPSPSSAARWPRSRPSNRTPGEQRCTWTARS